MTISSRYKDLLRTPTTANKLSLFQSLFDTKELTVDLALALLKIIHKELSIHQVSDRSVYKRYAEVIQSLRYHLSDMLQLVVIAWNMERTNLPVEWFSHDDPTLMDKMESEE